VIQVQVRCHARSIHDPGKICRLHAIVDDWAGNSERRRGDFRPCPIQKITGDFFQPGMLVRGITPVGDADQFPCLNVEETEISLGPSAV
jgi:hypothetical protein